MDPEAGVRRTVWRFGVGSPAGQQQVGSFPAERLGFFPGGETSEGQIPRALPVRNKTGPGFEGESRQEGNQTLETEPSEWL
jgi:hypothetical protein